MTAIEDKADRLVLYTHPWHSSLIGVTDFQIRPAFLGKVVGREVGKNVYCGQCVEYRILQNSGKSYVFLR